MASEILLRTLDTKLVPAPVEYAALVPQGYADMKDLPLVLYLHGGGGSRDTLVRQQKLLQSLWDAELIPPMIVVTPSVAERGFYMNFADGSERWEDFIMGPLLTHIHETLPVTKEPKLTFIMGASTGGMGALRMAFRYPDRFGAVAALEPGIEPILKWTDMKPKHQFWLYEGAEFLHRTLWDQKLKHEYHLVHGGGHIGPSLAPRSIEAIKFLIRSFIPWGEPPFKLRAIMKFLELKKLGLDEADHYSIE